MYCPPCRVAATQGTAPFTNRLPMARRDQEWPGYTQWYSRPDCRRLWTYQGRDLVVLDHRVTLGPCRPTPGVPSQLCSLCQGSSAVGVTTI